MISCKFGDRQATQVRSNACTILSIDEALEMGPFLRFRAAEGTACVLGEIEAEERDGG